MRIVWNTHTGVVTSDALPYVVAQVHEAGDLGAAAARLLAYLPADTALHEARMAACLLRRQAYPTATPEGAA